MLRLILCEWDAEPLRVAREEGGALEGRVVKTISRSNTSRALYESVREIAQSR